MTLASIAAYTTKVRESDAVMTSCVADVTSQRKKREKTDKRGVQGTV